MKQIGIIGLVAILIIFGSPLLSVKDNYKEMEYEEIGNTMLGNIETYSSYLETIATAAEKVVSIGKNTIDAVQDLGGVVSNGLIGIWNWMKGIWGNEEEEQDIICTEGANGNWYCQYEDGTPFYGTEGDKTEPPCNDVECIV